MKGQVETPCRDCCFAVYDGKTQVGCRFDRVEKFRHQGVEVVEAQDGEKEFFVIQTACLLHRHKKSPWAMRTPGRERVGAARKEVSLDVDVAVVMTGHTTAQVKLTTDSLLRQKPLPLKVTVVVNQDGVDAREVRNVLPGDWVVTEVFERALAGGRIDRGQCLDNAFARSKANFFAVFDPGFVVPDDFITCLDRAVNDEVVRFSMLEPDAAGQGLVVQAHLYRYVGGNAEATIAEGEEGAGTKVRGVAEKIRYMAKVNDMAYLVRKVGDVCPSLS